MDLWFDNYPDLKVAHNALAAAQDIRRVSYANGAERIVFEDGREIRFRVRTVPVATQRCPCGQGQR